MRIWISIVIFFVVSMVQAQTNTFQRSLYATGTSAERANCVRQTPDGGYILAGTSSGLGAGSYDMYLIRTDSNGDTLWTKTFGGSAYDVANSVALSADGGFVVAGAANSFSGTIFNDVYLAKTDMNGSTLWTKTYGGADTDEGYLIEQTKDGGFIIVGTTESFGGGSGDAYLLRTDSDGGLLWTKTYGGTGYDVATSLAQTTDGGFVLSGTSDSHGNNFDVYLIRTDMNGDTLWTKCYGGSNTDEGTSILLDPNGDCVVAGYTTSFGGGGDTYLLKTDQNGTLLWSKTFGGSGYEIGYDIHRLSVGGYMIAGTTASFGAGNKDAYLLKTNSDGNPVWAKTFGGTNNEFCYSFRHCSDNGYVLSGYTKSFGSFGEDAYLVKIDSLGTSGCNESTINFLPTAAATSVIATATKVFSGGVVNNPPSAIGSGGTVNTICGLVSVEENMHGSEAIAYPNPCNGRFEILGTNPAERIIGADVYNSAGEKVFTSNTSLTMEICGRAPGLYFYRVFFNNGNIFAGKIINQPQ